ncbi:MAG: methyltransferase [Chloroflexota bacterium]|nr:methyltransferase [Chloroflexota bacterium]
MLALLRGEAISRVPCFSGLISLTVPGLANEQIPFHAIYRDPLSMAQAATTTYRLFGFESVTVPPDLCVEAEALGATIDFRTDSSAFMFPIVEQPIASAPADLILPSPREFLTRGRIPIVVEVLRHLKETVGEEVAIGAFVPGPMTLAMFVVEQTGLMRSLVEEIAAVAGVLDRLATLLAEVALAYREAGADFLTIHEMGGSPGYLGPKRFESLVLPPLQRLLSALPAPRVLSVCGNTTRAMALLAQAGAEAISVDQEADLARAREVLEDILLFGNIDPVGVLANGTAQDVQRAVETALRAGVDAIWPGCDLWPEIPVENMRALVNATSGLYQT